MKAELKFEFDPENGDEMSKIKTLQNAENYKLALWDIDQKLRSELKYSELSEEVYDALDKIRSFLHETLNQYGLDLY